MAKPGPRLTETLVTIISSIARRHVPQLVPAPQVSPTSSTDAAPWSITRFTFRSDTPWQRQIKATA